MFKWLLCEHLRGPKRNFVYRGFYRARGHGGRAPRGIGRRSPGASRWSASASRSFKAALPPGRLYAHDRPKRLAFLSRPAPAGKLSADTVAAARAGAAVKGGSTAKSVSRGFAEIKAATHPTTSQGVRGTGGSFPKPKHKKVTTTGKYAQNHEGRNVNQMCMYTCPDGSSVLPVTSVNSGWTRRFADRVLLAS